LEDYKLSVDDLPFVIQYNKRDMPDVISLEDLEQEINPEGYPYLEAIATKGVGVFDTLKTVAKGILHRLSKN